MATLLPVIAGLAVLLAGAAIALRQEPALKSRLAAVGTPVGVHVPDAVIQARFLDRLGAIALARRLGGADRLQLRLELAGRPWSLETIMGARLAIAAAGCGLAIVAAFAAPVALCLAPILVLVAARVPDIVLARLARRRRESMAVHVPDLVELLVSTTEAGLNPIIAFQRSAEVLTGPLGDELRLTARRIELGLPWRKALDELASRSGVPSLRRLVAALARSNRLGTAVGSTLRGVATDLRAERRARAEELARRAPIKMLFPLVFLILPAFLLLTVGPVVLATIRSLH